MDDPFPGMSVIYRNKLRRAGIASAEHLAELIERFGLQTASGGGYYFGSTHEAPRMRGVGKKTWHAAIEMLNTINFDWQSHLGRFRRTESGLRFVKFRSPNTKAEKQREIKKAIDDLVVLLEEYKNEFDD